MITFQSIASYPAFKQQPSLKTPPQVFFGRHHDEPLELNNGLMYKDPSVMGYYEDFKNYDRPDKINMVLGFNPFPIPEIIQKLKAYADLTDPGPIGGLPELKSAIAKLYEQHIPFKPEQVFVGSSGSAVLDSLFRVLQGDVVVPQPSWPEYTPFAERSGKKVHKIRSSQGYAPSKKDLERAFSKTKAKILILNNPNNPTGTVFTKEQLQVIVDFCRKRGITILSDECLLVHPSMNYTTIAPLYPEGTIVISNGPSKALGVKGYGMAWAIVPGGPKGQEFIAAMKKYSPSAPATPVQWAITDSLNSPSVLQKVEKVAAFHRDRTISFHEQLKAIGIDSARPSAMFNLLVSFQKYKPALKKLGIQNDDDLRKYLLHNYGIGTMPGHMFGTSQFDYNLRMSTSALDYKTYSDWMVSDAKLPMEINRDNHPEMFSALDRLQSFIKLLEEQK
jgi:aspartate/methionine/tyrosine aminotransferase